MKKFRDYFAQILADMSGPDGFLVVDAESNTTRFVSLNLLIQWIITRLGSAATRNVGTGSGDVAPGNYVPKTVASGDAKLFFDASGNVVLQAAADNLAAKIQSAQGGNVALFIGQIIYQQYGVTGYRQGAGNYCDRINYGGEGEVWHMAGGKIGANTGNPEGQIHAVNFDATKPAVIAEGASGQSEPLVSLRQQSSTTGRRAGYVDAVLIEPADAIRTGRVILGATDYSLSREILRGEADGTQAKIGFLGASAVARPSISGKKGSPAQALSTLAALVSLGLATDNTTGTAPVGTGRFQRPLLISSATPSGTGVIPESAYTLPYGSDGASLNYRIRSIEWYVDVVNAGAPSLKIERLTLDSAKTTRTAQADLVAPVSLPASTYAQNYLSGSTTDIASGDILRINVTNFPANSPSRWQVRLCLEEV